MELALSASRVTAPDPAGLVAKHLAGDPRAFTELVRLFEARLLNFIDRMIGDRERAEDLVQEAFIRVHRHLHRYDPARKFSTWLYTIASNLARNELRDRARKPLALLEASRPLHLADEPVDLPDSSAAPDLLFERRELRTLVERTVAALPPHHREVFLLRELQGRSYEEIAAMTGAHLGTVKSRLNRARIAFAEAIAPHLA